MKNNVATLNTVTAIILTKNEAKHIERCISSISPLVETILVVDSHSTDETVQLAERLGAKVVCNDWVNYANQFSWGVQQLADSTGWVLRIDADEYLTPELATNLRDIVNEAEPDLEGVYCDRRMAFQGRIIKHGGVFPVHVLRLFRYGKGQIENRWMDEHIQVEGSTVRARGELIDDNLNDLTWWTEKHNSYASREAVDLLNLEYDFMPKDSVAAVTGGGQAGFKRWLKEVVYARFPGGGRAAAYFVYRYLFRLGFLDGKEGAAFHFLQGFWYRYLVDAKVEEVRRYMRTEQVGAVIAIKKVLGIKVA